jgi:2-keto-4-pentenoate hydratase
MAEPYATAVRSLADAARTGSPSVQPSSLGVTTVAMAYETQRAFLAHRLGAGGTVAGYKVGLTNVKLQGAFGTTEPVRGVLLDRDLHETPAVLSVASYLAARIEPELAFTLACGLDGDRLSDEEVAASVGEIAAAFEIVDSRIAGWAGNAIDLIADNGAVAAAVIGESRPYLGQDINALSCELYGPDGSAVQGSSAAVLGNPMAALAWLARSLAAAGTPLQAGQVVLSGSWVVPQPVTGPGKYHADFDLLGSVDVEFR